MIRPSATVKLSIGLSLIVAALAGCSKPAEPAPSPVVKTSPSATPEQKPDATAPSAASPTDTKPTPAATEPAAGETKPTDAKPTDSKPATGAPATTQPLELPASLKHSGYEYYGLANPNPQKLEIDTGNGVTQVGTRQSKLTSVNDKKATFTLVYTGALSEDGDITVSLESDGVYAMAISNAEVKPHALEMPATLGVGTTWKDHTDVKRTTGSIKLDNQVKVARRESIKTRVGTFDALLVTSTGSGLYLGQPATLETKSWYVRGRGPVKQIVTLVPKGQPKRTITMQEIP